MDPIQIHTNSSFFDESARLARREARAYIGKKLMERDLSDITLIEKAAVFTPEQIRGLFPSGRIFVCDFPVEGIERFQKIPGGYFHPELDIVNVDHHMPSEEMYRYVSAGNLASEYLTFSGRVKAEDHVLIHHTDCDSVTCSLMLRGHIPPAGDFLEAVIAADHTGEENDIADLLQALDIRRSVPYSARNLALHLRGLPIDESAKEMLQERVDGRQETAVMVQSKEAIYREGPVSMVHLTGKMRNEFLPSLLPEAAVIVTYEEMKPSGSWITRLRLGHGAPGGFTLNSLRIAEQLDPGYGGRWNAGSNNRSGGTSIPIKEYVDRLEEAYRAAISELDT